LNGRDKIQVQYSPNTLRNNTGALQREDTEAGIKQQGFIDPEIKAYLA